MKHQASFSSKDKSKKIKVSSAAIVLGALRVKPVFVVFGPFFTEKVSGGSIY